MRIFNFIQALCTFLIIYLMMLSPCSYAQNINKKIDTAFIAVDMDVVILKNGDRIQGELKQIERGELYFDGDKTNNVKIDLEDVRYLKGMNKLYRVEVNDLPPLIGKIDIAAQDSSFVIHTDSGDKIFQVSDIVTLRGYGLDVLSRIGGSVGIGYLYGRLSQINLFNLTDELHYTSERWQIIENSSVIYPLGTANGAERIDAGIAGIWSLPKRWFEINYLQYQRMLSLGIRSRGLGLAGLGRKLIANEHIELDAATGIDAQKEYTVDGLISNAEVEIPALLTFHLYQLDEPDIDVSSNVIYYYNLSVANRSRIDFKVNLGYEIIDDFVVSFQFFYNYDNKPLQQSASTADLGVIFAVGYKF